jgi:hypothetical protein
MLSLMCCKGLLRSVAVVMAAAVLLTACHKRRQVAAPPPAPAVMPKPVRPEPIPARIDNTIPSPAPGPDYAKIGDQFFEAHNYPKAAEAYTVYLHDHASGANADHALFRLAMTHLLPDSPLHDVPRATGLLQQVITRFPDSPFRPQSEYLLSLQGEIDRLHSDLSKRDDRIRELTQELERLKQIDMQRRPQRAPR